MQNPVLLEEKLSHFPPVSHCCDPLSALVSSRGCMQTKILVLLEGKILLFPPISRRYDPPIAQTMSSKPPEEQTDTDITQTLGKH